MFGTLQVCTILFSVHYTLLKVCQMGQRKHTLFGVLGTILFLQCRNAGRKVMPLVPVFILSMSSCDKSADLEGRVIAIRNTVFIVSNLSVRFFVSPRDSK